jgi:para-nitrobenzyl esterase
MRQVLREEKDESGDAARVNRRTFLAGVAGLGAGVVSSGLSTASSAQTAKAEETAPRLQSVVCSDSETVAQTAYGKLRGSRRNGVYTFKGVPYGASTSGSRRFMAPAKPEAWTGIRNALQYGPVCPNRDFQHYWMDGHNLATDDEGAYLLHRGASPTVLGEDCLQLNVWTPAIHGPGKRPVMVFMHGGGYTSGNGAELLSYDGENLARNHDVVVVTHNHRLNVFGYLNLAKLGGDRYADSANVGLLDLLAVLEWVKENIASFGGDAGSVTIFGQSGGGGKVLGLMTMPAAKGLFHRAIVESGPYLRALTPEYSERVAELVLEELQLTKGQVNQLQEVRIDRLHSAGMDAIARMPDPDAKLLRRNFGTTGWGPTVDGRILPQHFFEPAAPVVSAGVPLMTGTNLHEFINGVDRPDAKTMPWEQAQKLIEQGLGGDIAPIVAAYRNEYPQARPFDLYALIAACSMRRGCFEQAARKAALGAAPAYSYLYSWRTPALDDRPGPFHAAELAFVFDNAALCDHYSANAADAFALSQQMTRAWVAFARTGDPNHAGLPHWPSYSAHNQAVMEFNTRSQIRVAPESEALKLIFNHQTA